MKSQSQDIKPIELADDAWERFERGIKAIGKAKVPAKLAKKPRVQK